MTKVLPEGARPFSAKIKNALDEIYNHEDLRENSKPYIQSVKDFGEETGFLTEAQLSSIGKIHMAVVTKGYSHNSWWGE